MCNSRVELALTKGALDMAKIVVKNVQEMYNINRMWKNNTQFFSFNRQVDLLTHQKNTFNSKST